MATTGSETRRCSSCATELAPSMLSCPACQTLVYSASLKNLAESAQHAADANDARAEITIWSRALSPLPDDSQQHRAIDARITALQQSLTTRPATAKPAATAPWWRRWLAGTGTVLLLAIGKLKFLLLGLTKLSTLLSMFAFAGVYWGLYGWPLAIGLVVSIYIHEMGHVAELRRLGIDASAPLFVPGLGALVMLKKHVSDPVIDARIGLAGPIYGLAVGFIAAAIGYVTGKHVWLAIAQLTGYINLFNLIPLWQLDGSRGFHALDRVGRWSVAVLSALIFAFLQLPFLIIIAGVAAFRAFQKTDVTLDRRTLATFAMLVSLLSLLAAIPVATR